MFVFIGLTIFSKSKSITISAVDQINKDELCYVSLGDSIAAGHSLPNHNENNQYGIGNNSSTKIVDGCYTQLFRDNVLKSSYENINTISFARSGQTSAELLDKLQNDARVKLAVANADVITVFIGANDLLSVLNSDKTFWNMAMYLAGINDDIISDLEKGVATCAVNYPKIIETLNNLNPNAKILFNTVYNPYAEMKNTNGSDLFWISVPSVYAPSWYWDDWYSIPFAGGIFVDIGTATENLLVNLNNVIRNSINSLGNKNYCLVDVKDKFDKGSYDYIYCDIVSKSRSLGGITTDNIGNHLDAHPTLSGQNEIYKAIKEVFNNQFSFVNLNNVNNENDGNDNIIKIVKKNQYITENELPKPIGNNNQLFAGWFKDERFESKWDFEKDVLIGNTNLFAKWSSLTCLNEEMLSQLVNENKAVNFSVDVQDDVEWFVNGEKQVGLNGKSFSFVPKNYSAGEYSVCCKLGNQESNSFVINIDYYEPTELLIQSETLESGECKFYIADEKVDSINQNELLWFKKQGEQIVQVGTGTEFKLSEIEDCEIYVQFAGDNIIQSNFIEIYNLEDNDISENPNISFKVEHVKEIAISVGLTMLAMVYVLINYKKIFNNIDRKKLLIVQLIARHNTDKNLK